MHDFIICDSPDIISSSKFAADCKNIEIIIAADELSYPYPGMTSQTGNSGITIDWLIEKNHNPDRYWILLEKIYRQRDIKSLASNLKTLISAGYRKYAVGDISAMLLLKDYTGISLISMVPLTFYNSNTLDFFKNNLGSKIAGIIFNPFIQLNYKGLTDNIGKDTILLWPVIAAPLLSVNFIEGNPYIRKKEQIVLHEKANHDNILWFAVGTSESIIRHPNSVFMPPASWDKENTKKLVDIRGITDLPVCLFDQIDYGNYDEIAQLMKLPLINGKQFFPETSISKNEAAAKIVDIIRQGKMTFEAIRYVNLDSLFMLINPDGKTIRLKGAAFRDLSGNEIKSANPGDLFTMKWIKGVVPGTELAHLQD